MAVINKYQTETNLKGRTYNMLFVARNMLMGNLQIAMAQVSWHDPYIIQMKCS